MKGDVIPFDSSKRSPSYRPSEPSAGRGVELETVPLDAAMLRLDAKNVKEDFLRFGPAGRFHVDTSFYSSVPHGAYGRTIYKALAPVPGLSDRTTFEFQIERQRDGSVGCYKVHINNGYLNGALWIEGKPFKKFMKFFWDCPSCRTHECPPDLYIRLIDGRPMCLHCPDWPSTPVLVLFVPHGGEFYEGLGAAPGPNAANRQEAVKRSWGRRVFRPRR